MINLFDISHIISTYGYLGIFIIVFLESGIFFALPGDSLLFTAGLLAETFGLKISLLIPLIFLATFSGGLVGYEIGVYLIKLQNLRFFKKMLKQKHIDKAHEFFDKHGLMAIIFSRFIPIVRTFMPIVAGVARMHYATFVKYSLISSILWSFIVTLAGYFLGEAFPIIKDYLSWIVILVVLVSMLPMIFEIMEKRKKS